MNPSAATVVAPTRSRMWISVALAAMLIASLFSSAVGIRNVSAQDSQAGMASVAPADTVFYMSMNLDQSSDQWSLVYSLLERAGINDLVQDEIGATTEDLGGMAEASNFTGSGAIVFTDAESLASYTSGDFSSAVDTGMMMDGDDISEEIPEGFAFIMQPDDSTSLAAQFVQMTEEEAAAQGVMVETVEYNGVTITYWASDDPGLAGTATAEVDGTVVLATRASDIEPIIDAAQGSIDNLADTDGFNSVTSRLQSDTIMLGYMNLDVMISAFQSDPAFMDEMAGLSAADEVNAAKGHVGWAVYASSDGFHMDSVVIPNDPTMINDASSFTPSMPERVPADVMMFSNTSDFYGTGISDVLGELFQVALGESQGETTPVSPMATPTIDETWAMFEQQIGFNPDSDLLVHLDGEYAVFVSVHDLDAGMPTPEFLFVSETSDPAALQQTAQTISTIAEMLNDGSYTVGTRPVEGGELTTIELDPETTDGIPVVIEYGVVDGEMLIGINGAIDRYLDPAGDKLADDANFQNTMSLLPSENISYQAYINIEGQVMPLLDWFTLMLVSSTSTLDNHEDCGNYATQLEAQTAYDDDPGTLWLLDMDFDGEACEDFFGNSTPVASPESMTAGINIPAAGSVAWTDGEASYTSSILVIGD